MTEEDARKFMDAEYPPHIRGRLFPMLENAAEITRILLNEKEPGFFSGTLKENIRGHLLTFAVSKQFAPEFLPKSMPLQTQLIRVNNFGRVVAEISTPKSVLYINRVQSMNKLPKSKYIKKNATGNGLCENQLVFDFVSRLPILTARRKCALLVYGSRDKESIDFAKLVMPDSTLEYTLCSFDLKRDMSLYYNEKLETPKIQEKELLSLKREFQDYIKLVRADESD